MTASPAVGVGTRTASAVSAGATVLARGPVRSIFAIGGSATILSVFCANAVSIPAHNRAAENTTRRLKQENSGCDVRACRTVETADFFEITEVGMRISFCWKLHIVTFMPKDPFGR